MPKTLVEKITSPSPGVSIFKISGTLGFHENEVLAKFLSECARKGITKLVIDFSRLTSLGGGCARILREGAQAGGVYICVVGASPTVRRYLAREEAPLYYGDTVEEALETLRSVEGPVTAKPAKPAEPEEDTSQGAPADAGEAPQSSVPVADRPAAPVTAAETTDESNPDLRRKLLLYRSLLSLNVDFSRLKDKARLLDAFLLSTIAQIGVESAVFIERVEDEYVPVSWKGFETAEPDSMKLDRSEVDAERWVERSEVVQLDAAPITASARHKLESWDLQFAAPFVVYGELRGIVVLGKTIRKAIDDNTKEFLAMLISQAAVAYETSCLFEEESDRTLDLVQTLMSMIEENTVSRGSTDMIVHYTHAVAVAMHYPEEHMRDLIYGTVLRDIGMIKVSDLIVRSPRELVKEEWEIIKQHPDEGAQMLERMRFSEHTRNIVLCHHERFNGEGYPNRFQGKQIPFGARIVAVVESYAAMLQERPTRPALSKEEALNTLRENWGLRYDPEVVRSFVGIVEEEIRSGGRVNFKTHAFLRL